MTAEMTGTFHVEVERLQRWEFWVEAASREEAVAHAEEIDLHDVTPHHDDTDVYSHLLGPGPIEDGGFVWVDGESGGWLSKEEFETRGLKGAD